MQTAFIVVLNDGRTFTDLRGCEIRRVSVEDLHSGDWNDADDFPADKVWSLDIGADTAPICLEA